MASVFVVSKEGHSYALKTPKPGADAEYVKRFLREVRMMESIQSEHVLPIVESKLDVAEPYYIMPLCESSLADEVAAMNAEQRIQACIDFAKGILAIHQFGMRHRDIKPENALIMNGALKISDLGLGRFVDRDTTTMTTTMEAMGTFGYIPPEYYSSPQTFREGTIEGDIYMLGKSIYVICSGGGNAMYVDTSRIDPSVNVIVQKCIDINPANRYHNVQDVIDELHEVKNALLKLANQPLSLDEILQKRHLIDFEEQAYRYLRSIGNNNEEMAHALRRLDNAMLNAIFRHKQAEIASFAQYFDDSMSNPQTYIQFADVDEFARLQKILFELCPDFNEKTKILQSMIDFAHGYNRYPAMAIVGEVISSLSEDDTRKLYVFFGKNKAKLNDMKPHFYTAMPRLMNQVLIDERQIS